MLRAASASASSAARLLWRTRALPRAHARCLSSAGGLSIPGTPRALADITKLELLQDEPPGRIAAIWEQYHAERPGLAGEAIDAAEHELLVQRATESPQFVLPIRREGGHFMLFSQYAAAQSMFALTFLEDYQRSADAAQPWASVHVFDDLLTTKAVALLRAETVPERLTKAEAEHLLLLLRRYYATDNYDKAWTFNHAARHFDFDAFLRGCP